MMGSRANLNTDGEARARAAGRRADASYAEGLGDPRAEAQGSHGLVPQDCRRTAEETVSHAQARVEPARDQ